LLRTVRRHHGADLILLLPETPASFKRHKYVVYKRPGLDRFLLELDRLGFECVDRDGIIASVLARKACTWTGPSAQPLLFKDIDAIGRDPSRTVLIDDWPLCCSDSANLLQVPTFSTGSNEWQFGQSNAESTLSASAELPLNRLLTVLERLAEWTGDVRDFLSKADCVATYRSGLATAAAASN
uniref:Mitochondrial import inner membrane translocase subunit TIM50 n=1 Tax=Macrostomum lignano TaxID=282301 RepID=A0A1I8G7J2_9PLAT